MWRALQRCITHLQTHLASMRIALRAARTPPPPPPPLHDRTGRVTAQHAQDAQHAHGTHTCGRTSTAHHGTHGTHTQAVAQHAHSADSTPSTQSMRARALVRVRLFAFSLALSPEREVETACCAQTKQTSAIAISHRQKSNSVVGPRTGRVDIFPRDLGSPNSDLY